MNTKGDWQEYPYGMLQVTIAGQMELLMIVEDLILKGFEVVSLNTDGFDVILDKKREDEMRSIISEWEKYIGNDVLGQFEYTEYDWIIQTSVNDYLALKPDGSFKAKGDFEIDKELHKNSSLRIVPIALKEYYINDVPVEKTIKNHKDIFDFCIRQKATRDFHYEGVNENGHITVYNKLIRYYVSKGGEKIFKVKNEGSMSKAPKISQVEAGEWKMKVCNHLTPGLPDDINYDYYIQKCEEIIGKVLREGKKPPKKQPENQLNLFG